MEYAIALTGGIATGKSTVCSILRLHGFKVIDADVVAHQVLQESAGEVAHTFGADFVREGVVDRKALGRLIFSDSAAKKQLEMIVHPKIRQQILDQCAVLETKEVPYFVDIPLFFETGAYPIQRIVVVYAPAALQKARLTQREGLTAQEAQKRIAAQEDIESKRQKATWVIDNSGDIKALTANVEAFVREIHADYQI